MKSLLLAFLFVAGIIGILRSDMTPFRLKTAQELDEMQMSAAQAALAGKPPQHNGGWMWDSNYRTPLEKTTVIGVPERSKSREYGH